MLSSDKPRPGIVKAAYLVTERARKRLRCRARIEGHLQGKWGWKQAVFLTLKSARVTAPKAALHITVTTEGEPAGHHMLPLSSQRKAFQQSKHQRH